MKKDQDVRSLHKLFEEYAVLHRNPKNQMMQWIYIPLLIFSILGLIWAVPIQFHFLGKYKDFANLATILIGITMYYYWTLSRTLFWAMLFIVGVFSYFIVQLEYWEQAGGLAFWLVCAILFILGVIGLIVGQSFEREKVPFLKTLKSILIGPVYLWAKVFNKLKIPY